MTIKQHGGVFGRNPTFNSVEVDGAISAASSLAELFSLMHSGAAVGDFLKYSGAYQYPVLRSRGLPSNSGIMLGSGNVVPYQTSAPTTNAVDLGSAAHGFKNLYLTGNVIVANGQGIDFSATAGTGTSELFDDYEEGTFTATLTPSTSGTITLSGGFNQCSYVKIGSLVTVMGQLSVTSVASPVGYIELNLPFTCADLTDASGSAAGSIIVRLSALASVVNANDFGIIVLEGSATARIYLLDAQEWQSDSAEAMQQYTNITLNLTYRTA